MASNTLILPQMVALFSFTWQVKSNIQLKYSNDVAFSHVHGCAVNNLGEIKSILGWFIKMISAQSIYVMSYHVPLDTNWGIYVLSGTLKMKVRLLQ